jgi:PAS domain S-box-containing protein
VVRPDSREQGVYPVNHGQGVDPAHDKTISTSPADKVQDALTNENRMISALEAQPFSALADWMPHMVWLADAGGRVYWRSRRWQEYTGLHSESFAENGWRTVFDPEILPDALLRWEEAVSKQQPLEMRFRLRGVDGVLRQFLSRAVPLRDAVGQVTGWLGTNTEIESEDRMRDALELSDARMRDALEVSDARAREALTSSQRLAAIVESSDDAIVSKDLNGIVTSWNRGAMRLFGFAPDEIIGRSILTIIPPELHSEEPNILERLRSGRRIDHYETERLRKDGSRVHVSLTISPIRDSEGRVIGASKIARDITERVRMQDAIIESEKLAATGRMAAAIAHEINNPLEAVTNLAYLLSTEPSLSDSGKKYAALLLDEISRVSDVAKRSLAFFRDTSRPREFDVRDLLNNVISLNQPLLDRKHISVIRGFAVPAIIFGSISEIRQVFSNLIRNAIDALDQGGTIQLRTRPGRSGMLHILVADDGHGISPGTKKRLFQPFVTTKGPAGNGLGLWVSRGIVHRHNGRMLVKSCSKPGHSGTVFAVVLPTSENNWQRERAASLERAAR